METASLIAVTTAASCGVGTVTRIIWQPAGFQSLCLRHIACNVPHRDIQHTLHRNRMIAADGQ